MLELSFSFPTLSRRFAVCRLSRNSARTTGRPASGVNALDIAKERYARGEITKEQFDQIKRDLS